MAKQLRVVVLFGGKSAEHEVSLQSARSIINALDKSKYDVTLVGIDKQGKWYLNDQSTYLLNAHNPKLIKPNASNEPVVLVPGDSSNQLVPINPTASTNPLPAID